MTDRKFVARSKLGWITRRANGKASNAASNWLNHRIDGTFKKSKRNKYNQQGRWIGEHFFHSKAEADRFEQLVELETKGVIADLEIQVPYPCRVNNQLITTYLADFRYRIRPRQLGSKLLVEEVKGKATREYIIKRKLVHALHAIEIIELKVPKRGGIARYRYLTADQFGVPEKGEGWTGGSSTG